MPLEEVKTWANKEEAVLSEHYIYHRVNPGSSRGKPMLRCALRPGTSPTTITNGVYSGGRDDDEFPWPQSEPAAICANRFRCRQCGLYLEKKHFPRGPDGKEPQIDTQHIEECGGGGPSRFRRVLEALEKGEPFEEFCTVLCKTCKSLQQCHVCKEYKRADGYSQSAWQNRAARSATCLSCEAESRRPCQQCGHEMGIPKARCSRCNKVKPRAGYSAGHWLNKGKKDRQIVCLECEDIWGGLRCDICGVMKPPESFTAGSWKHKADQNRCSRCLDCAHPPCMFLPNCKTCEKCRGAKCKAPNCTKAIETLPSPQLPTTAEDARSFACETCRYVRCTVVQTDGTRCGAERRQKTRAKAKARREHYECGQCQTWKASCSTLEQ